MARIDSRRSTGLRLKLVIVLSSVFISDQSISSFGYRSVGTSG
jgi:hypothetical protein